MAPHSPAAAACPSLMLPPPSIALCGRCLRLHASTMAGLLAAGGSLTCAQDLLDVSLGGGGDSAQVGEQISSDDLHHAGVA